MAEARADALLKSALEKIVYFEARVEQLQSDGAAASSEAERLRAELSAAAQREIALRRQIAELEVKLERGHREREELLRMNEALRNERKGWLDKLLDAAQIGSAGSTPDALDLASFIAALRSEAWGGKRPTISAEPAHAPPAPVEAPLVDEAAAPTSGLTFEAERLGREGRLGTTAGQLQQMASPRGQAERTLFGFSVHELSSPDARARIRAAERLRALGDRAAAPALATALHAETEAHARVCLLGALARVGGPEAAEVVLPFCEAGAPEVRIAALEALLALDPSRAHAHLEAAAADPDAWVRRRAALLALRRPDSGAAELSARAVKDSDPHVRRLSTLALAATGGRDAKLALLEALEDTEPSVRKAAASSLSLLLGRDVRALLALEPSQRRREIRRLANQPERSSEQDSAHPVQPERSAQRGVEGSARPRHRDPPSHSAFHGHAMSPDPSTPALRAYAQGERVARAPAKVAVAVVERAAADAVDEALCAWILTELRAAIRGRTAEELVSAGAVDPARLEKTCAHLAARGQVVRRGRKYFVA